MKKRIVFYAICFILLVIGLFFDKGVVSFIAGYRTNFLTQIMSWFSFFGTWFMVLLIMTSLFLWQEKKSGWIIPLWVSLALSFVVASLLKLIIMRTRPELALSASLTSSFPSGHATAVFSTLAILDKEFPKFRWFWLGFALVVAFSRLYLGMHYLTDVVVGAMIGYTVSLFVVKFKTRKLKK